MHSGRDALKSFIFEEAKRIIKESSNKNLRLQVPGKIINGSEFLREGNFSATMKVTLTMKNNCQKYGNGKSVPTFRILTVLINLKPFITAIFIF